MFTYHKTDTGAVPPWEYMPAAAGTYQVGQLLNANDGVLTPISTASATTPGYVCMANVTVTASQSVPVTRIQRTAIYETQLSASAADAKVGTKLQVSAGGLQVDAATVGSFEITEIEDTAAGSAVRGRFN